VSSEHSSKRKCDQTFPVSYAQQRLWLLERMLPAGAVYNTGQVLRLSGELAVAALERALAEVVRRHEALRTRFAVKEGVPVQVVSPALVVTLAAEAVAGATAAARRAAAMGLAQAEAQRGFELGEGPLWRVRLWQLEAEEHWLQLTMHHIVTDGWSTGVLKREMSVLYAAYRNGEASPLAALPVQYADYAVWQRQWLQGEGRARQLADWREARAEVPVLALPTDRPRPRVPSDRGGRVGGRLGWGWRRRKGSGDAIWG